MSDVIAAGSGPEHVKCGLHAKCIRAGDDEHLAETPKKTKRPDELARSYKNRKDASRRARGECIMEQKLKLAVYVDRTHDLQIYRCILNEVKLQSDALPTELNPLVDIL